MKQQRYRRRKKRVRIMGLILRILLPIVLVFALCVGAVIFFKLETIAVGGQSRYTGEEIVLASKLTLGRHLLLIDREEVQDQIMSALPYVQSAKITVRLPSSLEILVVEEIATFEVQYLNERWLMGYNGKLLERNPEMNEESGKVVTITGLTLVEPSVGLQIQVLPEQEVILEGVREAIAAFTKLEMMNEVSGIEISREGFLEVNYQERFLVKLRPEGDFEYSLRAFLAAAEELEEYESGTMDLTRSEYAVLFTPD